MAGTLRNRAAHLYGILNGIDIEEWNPDADEALPANYSVKKMAGKARCKAAFQKEVGLPVEPNVPLVGMISRLVAAKGFDLITRAMEGLLATGAQFFVLGTGEKGYEEAFETVAREHPDQFAARIGYDTPLSHRIIAASDIFLMPSYFEPCGLTQLYSMRYGTIPLVRRTGGLADSVFHATKESIRNGLGTGFVFDDYRPDLLAQTMQDAVDLYTDHPKTWQKLMKNAMEKDFSWQNSAKLYERLYETVISTPAEE
jgi:starch synthase